MRCSAELFGFYGRLGFRAFGRSSLNQMNEDLIVRPESLQETVKYDSPSSSAPFFVALWWLMSLMNSQKHNRDGGLKWDQWSNSGDLEEL
jgi:hypothetical protein